MSVVSIITCTPLYAGESELERLKSGFKNKINSVIEPLVKRHKISLFSLEKSLVKVSNIEDALLVREERLRIPEMEILDLIESIPESPEKLRSQVQRFNREVLSAINIWEKKYEKALMGLEYRLTRLDKLNEALLVKIEIKRFKEEVSLRRNQNGYGEIFSKEQRRNFALKSNGASAKAERFAELLIDGKTKHSKFSGFAWGNYPTDFEVIFPKTTRLEEIKFLLWEGREADKPRTYLYQLYVQRKEDGEWEMIADYSKRPAKGWQSHKFSSAEIKAIKILGIFNSANEGFHVVEIEAY